MPFKKTLAMSALMSALFASACAVGGEPAASYEVGVTERGFTPQAIHWRGEEQHLLRAVVWYPAEENSNEVEQTVGPPGMPLFKLGAAAPDATPASAPAKFPLVLLSHGMGGAAGQMAWLGRTLAAQGYIAVAVDHPGNNARSPHTMEGFSLWWERASDISAALDAMLADPVLGVRIDAGRIGAAGFSLGGYTMVVLAGGITEPARLRAYCATAADRATCSSPPEFPGLVEAIRKRLDEDAAFRHAFGEASRPRRDSRIRAVLAIAPSLGPAFAPESLKAVSLPVALVSGDADAVVPPKVNAEYFASVIPGAGLSLLKDVGHYSFLASCTGNGKARLPMLCIDPPGIERDDVHARTSALAVRFFNEELNKSGPKEASR
ncbi:MAG: peptidase [Paucimonas sp.]|nr:peptidase [Paucimonas sp.]